MPRRKFNSEEASFHGRHRNYASLVCHRTAVPNGAAQKARATVEEVSLTILRQMRQCAHGAWGYGMRTASPTRWNEGFFRPLERPALAWLAAKMPRWVTPDHLTGIGFVGAVEPSGDGEATVGELP